MQRTINGWRARGRIWATLSAAGLGLILIPDTGGLPRALPCGLALAIPKHLLMPNEYQVLACQDSWVKRRGRRKCRSPGRWWSL